ncbi:virulence RhuM family protein [Treponema primitia]|uniref:virulence RhuM family protein n=1 Tax=Treponema primitia TaxID=88058 RepID=UPI00397EFECF
MKKLPPPSPSREIIIYRTDSNDIKVEVLIQDESLWLTQEKMSELFDVNVPAISKHLSNIFEEGELERAATISKMETVQTEGNRQVRRNKDYYNLDAIIAVGYRVNSKRATQFRIWATKILKEYIVKGFAMNDERLKQPDYLFGQDYFEEQLERIRDIRSSERRFYQKITDIYSQCSADYDPENEITQEFFATVQNKLHFAISHETAAEIVYHRANAEKPNMGLTTWKNAPKGKIRKSDVSIAKNYLQKDELDNLNRIVTMYLDYAENQSRHRNIMYMKDWVEKLDAFLKFNEEDILHNAGKISHEIAADFAENQFEKYRGKQELEYKSDFDKLIESVDKRPMRNKEK